MQVYLEAQNDDLWNVITEGPTKTSVTTPLEDDSQMMVNPLYEWTAVDKKKAKIDNMAKNILYKALDDSLFNRIKLCSSAKEIWERLMQIYEGNDRTKENKLLTATHKYESIRMYSYESLDDFDERFCNILIELSSLGKNYTNREVVLKAMRALPREWEIKTVAMKESRDLNKLEIHDFFADLKAYEFETNSKIVELLPNKRNKEKALLTAKSNGTWDDTESEKNSIECFVADEYLLNQSAGDPKNKSSWADSDSEECPASETEEEEDIKCKLADDDQVFDFSSNKFSKEELVDALNDMVMEYKNLSERMSNIEAENLMLKQQANSLVFKTPVSEINNLRVENSKLNETIFEKDLMIQKLEATVSAWTSSSTSLKNIINEQRSTKCKFGLGYSGAETDGITKVGKTIQFVKSSHVDTLTENKNLFSKTEPTILPSTSNKPIKASWLKPKVRAASCSKPYKKPACVKQKKGFKNNEKNKTILFGKYVRIIKVWIPKGIINQGPK